MDRPITNISVYFKGKKGRERKYRNMSHHLSVLEGHVKPDLESYKQKALDMCKLDGIQVLDETYRISANFGKDDGEMRFIELIPKYSIVFKEGV